MDFKKEARRQYFKYFRWWFVAAGVLLVIFLVNTGIKMIVGNVGRTNTSAPAERVYDYANVLTDEEEQKLREYIAQKEHEIRADIVIVTIYEPMEKDGISWETAMMNYADDFYDNHNYGYDKARGNGVLLLDNWYDGQAGSWLATCGNVYEEFGDYEINEVLDAVYYNIDYGTYNAYREAIYTTTLMMGGDMEGIGLASIFVPIVVALIYACVNLRQKKAKDTTTAATYVACGKPVMNVQRDDFIRKNVVRTKIQTSSSSGGGHSSGGRGGSHRSSSGTRHGGGGRRR